MSAPTSDRSDSEAHKVVIPGHQPSTGTVRLWPAVLLAALGWGIFSVARHIDESAIGFMVAVFAPAACSLLTALWWVFLSRVSWRQRGKGLGISVLVVPLMVLLAHPSMYFYLPLLCLPTLLGAIVLTRAGMSFLAWPTQRRVVGVVGTLVFVGWVLTRSDGATGEGMPTLNFRWAAVPEEKAREYFADRKESSGAIDLPTQPAADDWPGFRGPQRDSAVRGVTLLPWTEQAPRKVWSHPVFPGWSSFCVVGDYLFTQEQREQDEAVVCYRTSDGEQIWVHREQTRFFDQAGGPGPRATPTYSDGKLLAFGATGVLVCLDPRTGKRLWSTEVSRELGGEGPVFGLSCSPIVWQDRVIVSPGAKGRSRLVAFSLETGKLLWSEGNGTEGYSSPQLVTLAGVPQVLMFALEGLFSHDPKTGKQLWQFDWSTSITFKVTQPQVLPGERIVLAVGDGHGTRVLDVRKQNNDWDIQGKVKTTRFKPQFNDFVCHDGFLYGLDKGGILVCIDLSNGQQRWKDGRYGYGQVLLVGKHVLVTADDGTLALVEATPDGYREVGRLQGVEGKTWNHPAFVRGRLFVRNGQEIACYELPMEQAR